MDGCFLVEFHDDGWCLVILACELVDEFPVGVFVGEGEDDVAEDVCLHVHCADVLYFFEEEADVAGQVVDGDVVVPVEEGAVGGEIGLREDAHSSCFCAYLFGIDIF